MRRAACLLLWVILVLLATGGNPLPAHAQEPAAAQTDLTIEPLEPFTLEEEVVVEARLDAVTRAEGFESTAGQGAAGQQLELYLNGVRDRVATTDAQGVARFEIRRDLPAATYEIQVRFEGTAILSPASVATVLEISPAWLTVQTVPPLADVPIAIEGQTFHTDSAGRVQYQVIQKAELSIEMLPIVSADPSQRAGFVRWDRDLYEPQRTITVRRDRTIYAGLELSRRVAHSFVDPSGRPIAPERVSSLRVSNNEGEILTFESFEPRWLRASSVTERSQALTVKPIVYTVQSVVVDGSEVVTRGSQTLEMEAGDQWQIELLLFSATLSARDALFGYALGNAIDLEYPDGETRSHPFGPDGVVRLEGLARGLYYAQVVGAPGIAPLTPMALSRNQEVELLVLSWLDIGLVLGLGIVVALGLLFLGRSELRPWRRRDSTQAPVGVPVRGHPARSAGAGRDRLSGPDRAR